jgi:hypothetical protein
MHPALVLSYAAAQQAGWQPEAVRSNLDPCEMLWVESWLCVMLHGLGLAFETLHRGLTVFVRPDAWLGRLRGCPPCRPRADDSSLMPLRRPSQAPGQPTGWVCAAA